MADALKQKEASAEADRLSKFAAPLKRLNTQVATPGVFAKVGSVPKRTRIGL